MDKSDTSDGKSIAMSLGEMVTTSWIKQWTVVNEVEMHVEAIQSLVKCQKETLLKLRNQVNNENNVECGNATFFSSISCNMEKIYEVINDEDKGSLSPISSSFLFNQADDVAAVVEKALNNSVVLRTIMNHLNTRNLFCCRSVTKSWKEEADIQLLSGRQRAQVQFDWQEEEKQYQNAVGTLKEFTQCCYSDPHRKFPYSNIKIHLLHAKTDNEETQVDLVNFFSKYGHHIKNLHLECSSNAASAYKLLHKIIFEWTPNLKSLIFEFPFVEDEQLSQDVQQPPESEDDTPEVSTISLPNLQELCLENIESGGPIIVVERCKQLVGLILASAPNLKRVEDFALTFTKEIVASGKIKAVDTVDVYASSDTVSNYVQFSRALPQVTSLTLNLEQFLNGTDQILSSDFVSSLQLILESSRMTLKTLELFHRLHFNPDNLDSVERLVSYQGVKKVMLVLENLEELQLRNYKTFRGGAGWIFPEGFSFQLLFPRLKQLDLGWIFNQEENYEVGRTDNPFANPFNSSTTIERLIISPVSGSSFHLEWISQARFLYPNVRVLLLGVQKNWMELPRIFRRLWKSWNESSLEELKITMSASYNERNGNFAEKMDQVLTGFDIKTCRKLRKKSSSESCEGDEGFKRGSSILDMSNLKLFQLGAKSTGGIPLFSRVSVIHAFDPMRKRQDLRVVINGAKLQDMIQEGNVDFSPM